MRLEEHTWEKKIKQFANDGNFLNIVRWTQDQGNQ